MTTPYDAALRIAERRLDAVRAALGLAIDELGRIECAHVAIEESMRREIAVAADDPRLTTERFFVRARAERTRLGRQRHIVQNRLEALRTQAVECYGSQIALQGTVADHQAADAERAAKAEQAMLDDLVAARRTPSSRPPRQSGSSRRPA